MNKKNTEHELKAVVKYPGAKWRIAGWIIDHIPPHRSYVEPYLGSGAIFFRKSPSKIETINDLDGEVVNLFECIREDAEKLSRLIEMTPYSRQEYLLSYVKSPTDKYNQARKFLIRCWQGYGYRTNSYTEGWKNDVAGREAAYALRNWNRVPMWMVEIVERLKQAQIECKPALDVIRRLNNQNVLIYADPPYLLRTRNGKQYAFEMTDEDHIELLESLKKHQGPVLLSGYDNDLYNNILAGWEKDQIAATAKKGKHRAETLWMNYSPPCGGWSRDAERKKVK